ncbi:uncharacterized protein LOC117180785 [Belonocnema kinseyi]|uniref:uncharacterized protein LOC117180785 n=1 Tax=Belonocnema kinseyi TaxID=2817044 RepID=UPI00143D6986|nr:uncharacterized protein LOC117180785 [Belonocnema kinseyi]
MRLFKVLSIFVLGTTFVEVVNGETKTLFDFRTLKDVQNWMEISDTVRPEGKSKATLVLKNLNGVQSAVFNNILNPQPNGAAFAGMRTTLPNLNLSSFKNITISCRGEGNNMNYKIVLRHNGQHANEDNTYEQFFTVSMSTTQFSTNYLPLQDFKAFFRGQEVMNATPLNTANITMFGLQMYGGVYLPIKQTGESDLIIEAIYATS